MGNVLGRNLPHLHIKLKSASQRSSHVKKNKNKKMDEVCFESISEIAFWKIGLSRSYEYDFLAFLKRIPKTVAVILECVVFFMAVLVETLSQHNTS